MLIRDPDGTIRFWSEGAARLYGFSHEEAVGWVSHDLLRTEFPQPLAEIDAALLREGVWNGGLRHRRRDGFPVQVASHWILGRSPRDGPIAVIEVDNHSSEHEAVEEAVRRIAEEFRQAGEKAEQDNLTKAVFLAAVCRDLSQLVQSLVLSSAALAPHLDGAKGHETLTVLDCRLNMLKDLLGMWRLAVGAVEPKVATASVRSLLDVQAHLREAVHVGLARPVVAALHGVVEQTVHAVAVVP